ncbi:hypothetical protein GGI21_001350, partial [Coemansia aciculifera]
MVGGGGATVSAGASIQSVGGGGGGASSSSMAHHGGFVGATRATDPLNDIGSPVNLQYLQYAMSSPFFISDTVPATVAAAAAVSSSSSNGAKQLQAPPALVVTGSPPMTSGGASSTSMGKLVLSPVIDDTLPGFFHPAQVFTTPKIEHLPEDAAMSSSQRTPDLALFDDNG